MHLPALAAYLQGLRENNNKAWFVMNKPAYDILRAEFTTLVAEVIAKLSKHDPSIGGVDAKKALFRIYRDIRFSNDKTPYKTYFSASLAGPGDKHSGPMYYLHIDAECNLHLGAGCWMPEREALARLRRHVVDDFEGLTKRLKAKRLKAVFGGLNQDDRLARLPKGYDASMPGIERYGDFVRLKSFVVSADVDLTDVANAAVSRALPTAIAERLAAAAPFNAWIRAALQA